MGLAEKAVAPYTNMPGWTSPNKTIDGFFSDMRQSTLHLLQRTLAAIMPTFCSHVIIKL